MEIPKKINYDVYLLILGIFFILIPLFLYLNNILISDLVSFISILTGITLTSVSSNLIREEFKLERDLMKLNYAMKKSELLKYFEKSDLLSEGTLLMHKKEIILLLKK